MGVWIEGVNYHAPKGMWLVIKTTNIVATSHKLTSLSPTRTTLPTNI